MSQRTHAESEKEAERLDAGLTAIAERIGNFQDTWALECFRALIVLNGGGLAGAVALVAANKEQFTGSLLHFIVGIAAAFVGIFSGWVMHTIQSNAWDNNHSKFAESLELRYLELRKGTLRWVKGRWIFQVVAGLGSLVAFTLGGWRFLAI